MIAGIGIDLVECGRFLDWSAFKKQRIFTKKELEYAEKESKNSLKFDLLKYNEEQKNIALQFQRRLDNLSNDEIRKLRKILEKRSK